MLWFAFRLYLWNIGLQQVPFTKANLSCCDLLSDCIFEILVYNLIKSNINKLFVVICFQIVSLKYWFTTCRTSGGFNVKLWFAFRLYLWNIGLQHIFSFWRLFRSCDLLSDCIFEILVYNEITIYQDLPGVVICFQIVSLKYWFTTWPCLWVHILTLWFAFRLYLWNIGLQPSGNTAWAAWPLWFAFRLYLWNIGLQQT